VPELQVRVPELQVKAPELQIPPINPELRIKVPELETKASGSGMSNQKPDISFNLNNQTTVPVTAKPAGTSFNGKQWVVDVVLEEVRTNRGFAEQMRRG